MLKDAGGQVLGTIMSVGTQLGLYIDDIPAASFVVLTSAGYIVGINYDGTLTPGQLYFTGTSCNGTPYLNSGSSASNYPLNYKPKFALKKIAAYSRVRDKLFAVDQSTVNANGAAQDSCNLLNSIEDYESGCANATDVTPGWVGHAACGWKLGEVTRASIGLPATIAPPLAYP